MPSTSRCCQRQSRGPEPSRSELTFPLVRPRGRGLTLYLTLVVALLLLVAPAEALRAQARESLPSPMSGIEVSESQRVAMRASWAEVAAEWDAILERSRAAGTVNTEDSRRLSQLASEHNARLLGIFTEAQRERLERNLEALREERERRATEPEPVRTPPSGGDASGAAVEEVVS